MLKQFLRGSARGMPWSNSIFFEGEGEGGGNTGAGAGAGEGAGKGGSGQQQQQRRQDPPAARHEPLRDTEKEISDLRAENAARRIAERDAKDALTAEREKNAKLEADAKAAKEERDRKAEDRLRKLREKTINSELKVAAQAAGLRDLDLLPLIDRKEIKVDDDDNVTGINEAIEALKKKKPEWFAAATGGAGSGGSGDGKGAGGARREPSGGANPSGTGQQPAAKEVRELNSTDYRPVKNAARQRLAGVR